MGRYQLGYIVKELDSLISVNQEGMKEFSALAIRTIKFRIFQTVLASQHVRVLEMLSEWLC